MKLRSLNYYHNETEHQKANSIIVNTMNLSNQVTTALAYPFPNLLILESTLLQILYTLKRLVPPPIFPRRFLIRELLEILWLPIYLWTIVARRRIHYQLKTRTVRVCLLHILANYRYPNCRKTRGEHIVCPNLHHILSFLSPNCVMQDAM